MTTRSTRTLARLVDDARGGVFVEYLFAVGTFALVAALAAVSLGEPMLRAYRFTRALLLLPFP
ncbi:hypothetical protein [Sandaracinus amylolyticus]|uniref:hypothetical protein n=1 Tax=Sandaracinus amylolyticus TaxID=927083 RepID=UPI00146FCE94|nr:hypothetical protein [Sandaracinus amylolyticus]